MVGDVQCNSLSAEVRLGRTKADTLAKKDSKVLGPSYAEALEGKQKKRARGLQLLAYSPRPR